MKIRFFLRPVFQEVDEGEIIYGLIAYAKRPYIDEQVIDEFGQQQTIVRTYKRFLQLNFWLFKIRFDWIK